MKQPGGHQEPVGDARNTDFTTVSRSGPGITALRMALVQMVSDISGIPRNSSTTPAPWRSTVSPHATPSD